MRKNPRLKVFFGQWAIRPGHAVFHHRVRSGAHGAGAEAAREHEFGYYPSGHMIYLNVDALKQLKSDLAGFYTRATEGGN